MDSVCRPLDFGFVCLENILVAGASLTENRAHLFRLFKKLSHFGIVVNVDKCQFGPSQTEFLGYLVTKRGARPLPSKVEVIQNFSLPTTTTKDLQRFVGVDNFYHRFIPAATAIMAHYTKQYLEAQNFSNVRSPYRRLSFKLKIHLLTPRCCNIRSLMHLYV